MKPPRQDGDRDDNNNDRDRSARGDAQEEEKLLAVQVREEEVDRDGLQRVHNRQTSTQRFLVRPRRYMHRV